MPFPDLSAYPPWMQALFIIAFAVSLAVGFVVAKLGIQQGQKAVTRPDDNSAQVAAVIVDATALNKATGEISGLAVVLTQVRATMEKASAATIASNDALTDAKRDEAAAYLKLSDEIAEVRTELKIMREVARNRSDRP